MCVNTLCAYMYVTTFLPDAIKGQKRVSEPLELMVMSHCIGARY